MSLQNWLNNGWLTEHRTSLQEITALLGVADRDLTDCKTSGLSPDWQLNIAYNAAAIVRCERPIIAGLFNHSLILSRLIPN